MLNKILSVKAPITFQAKKDGAEDTIAKYDGEWAIEQLLKDPLTGKVTRSHHMIIVTKLPN